MQKRMQGALKPLFDRIVNDEESLSEGIYLDEKALRLSVIKEVDILLNTRCTTRRAIYDDHINNIPLFGLPDFFGLNDLSDFDPNNSQQWSKIAKYIKTAITAFEPRLKDVNVKIKGYDQSKKILKTIIDGVIESGNIIEKITFHMKLSESNKSYSSQK